MSELKGVECGVKEGSPYNYQRFGIEVEVPGLNSRFRNRSQGSGIEVEVLEDVGT